MAIIDYRRTDLHNKLLGSTYTITSGEITSTADDKEGVLFSFPATKYGNGVIIINYVMLEVITAFNGTPVCTFGFGTIATDAVTTGGAISIVDVDMLMEDTVGACDTTGIKIQGASGFVTGAVTSIPTANVDMIVPADTTVPIVYCKLTATGTITTGSMYFHMNITEMPSVG
jgi:hypothetical protein